MNRFVATIGLLLAASVLFWFYPLFHVVPRGAAKGQKQAGINATDYVNEFWTATLTPAFGKAAEAEAVLASLHANPMGAKSEFGRTVGLSRTSLYFLRGSGQVVSVDDTSVGVALSAKGGGADVALQTGLLFGNTVRDATGLIRGDEFSNSQQFNEISTELNRIVETQVIPSLKQQAKVGSLVEFVGCAEVTNLPRDISPLQVVPLEVKIQ